MEVRSNFVHYFSKETSYRSFFTAALRQQNNNYGLISASLNNANSLYISLKPTSEKQNLFYVTSSK